MGSRSSLGSSSLVSSASSSNEERPILIEIIQKSNPSKPQNWSKAKDCPPGYTTCPRGCQYFVLKEAIKKHSFSKDCPIYYMKIQSGEIDLKIRSKKAKKKSATVGPAFVHRS